MASTTYRVRLVRNGHETEIEGDKKFVLDMLALYEPNAASLSAKGKLKATAVAEPPAKNSTASKKSISIREFIQRLEFKKHTDITLAFGYYLEHFGEASEFTPADINNCYYEAKLESSNTSQMIIQNIKRGYLMPSKQKGDGSRKRYTLTSSGEKFVEAALEPSS
jgi:hypothetical protein